MLSRPVSRAAHHTAGPSGASSTCLRQTAPSSPLPPGHRQHRRSSSKTSHPPGAPPLARNSARTNSSNPENDQEKRRASANGASRRRSRTYSGEDSARTAQSDAFSNVPAVQPTSHLNLSDVKLSSLFALHRPISINPSAAYPPMTSNKSFNALFSPPRQSKISDEIYTMAPQSSSSNAPASDGAIYLDGPPSLEQLARQFRPFQKPPAPVPFGDQAQPAEDDARGQRGQHDRSAPSASASSTASGRTYTTTLTIQEATTSDGQKTYTASATPIVERREGPTTSRSLVVQSTPARQPFLSRMHARSVANDKFRQERVASMNRRWEAETDHDVEEQDGEVEDLSREMIALSVKRQRKLKMKKHKYKKLMRRTRNLRRREGRL